MNGSNDAALEAVREALRVCPDNIALHKHYVDLLMEAHRYEEAEAELRAMLATTPDDEELKLTLAQAFASAGKASHALALVEEMVNRPDASALVRRYYAELLWSEGSFDEAQEAYRAAVAQDDSVRDIEFEADMGLRACWMQQPEEDDNTSEEEMGDRVPAAWSESEDYDSLDSDNRPTVELERPPIDFRDVGGMTELKEEIRMKIIYPLQHAEMFAAYGKSVGGGILMYGPPGCGKTHLARATAGEIDASFLAVGINDVLDMWLGNSERNLHELFETARRSAPCVLFFDEIDALGASRSDMKTSGGRHLINQLLSELDGVKSSNEGVLILAATNAPWHMDSALRRPGRFDRVLFVPPPDEASRAEILRVLCAGKPISSVDPAVVAKKTKGFSGADLKAVVDMAVEAKLSEALKRGQVQPLSTRDLVAAARRIRPSTKEWFASARNYALYANQAGLYDDVLRYLNIR